MPLSYHIIDINNEITLIIVGPDYNQDKKKMRLFLELQKKKIEGKGKN